MRRPSGRHRRSHGVAASGRTLDGLTALDIAAKVVQMLALLPVEDILRLLVLSGVFLIFLLVITSWPRRAKWDKTDEFSEQVRSLRSRRR